MSPSRRSAGEAGGIVGAANDVVGNDDAIHTHDTSAEAAHGEPASYADAERATQDQQSATFASDISRRHAEANQFADPSTQQQAHQQQVGWSFPSSAAHPNDLPANVITAYSANSFYSQQAGQEQEQGQQDEADHSHLAANNLPLLPDSESYHQETRQEYDHTEAADALGVAAKGDPDASMADYSQQADTSASMLMGGGDDDDDMSPNKKKAKLGSGRVAKACQPCSSKKRRCDGGRPECSVCRVLGTPCSYTSTGLKRGPPKGFRAGPKESLRAKLTRTLETTIRDLTSQLGVEEASREISRVSRERGLPGHVDVSASDAALVVEALANSSNADLGMTQRAIQNSLNHQEDDSTFLGVTERGDLTHRGSSSGLHLLRRTAAGAGSAQSPPGSSPGSSIDRKRNEPMVLPIPSPSIGNAQPFLRTSKMDQLLSQISPQHSPLPQDKSAGALQPHLSAALDPAFRDPVVTAEESYKLFTNYWRSFHPYWPILYKSILDEIPHGEIESRLDGLLLNAIYAIGSSGRDSSALQPEDEDPEESARRSGELFAQAAERRLFATGLRPTVTAIQASFMLSVFAHGNGELSRAWSFCGIAINMAMDLGLHRWPIHRLDLLDDSAERETRTRTIWCLYVLDKILCAEMGRAPILRAREMDPPLLSENTPDELEYMDGDPSRPMRIPSVFNTAVHCFAIVERILSEVHSLRRKAVLRRGQTTPDLLKELDEELEKFRRDIPEPIQIPADGSRPRVGFPGIVWALGVWDATATILLHRPFIPQQEEGSSPSYDEVVNNVSHQKASAAADRLCELLQLDVGSRPTEYDVALWPSDYAYCLFTAAVMYLFNARLGVPGARQKFALARDQIKRLSSRWPTASAHRQLLDGFTAVADDALGRPETSSGDPTVSEGGAVSIEEWTAQTAAQNRVQQAPPQVSGGEGQSTAQGNGSAGPTTQDFQKNLEGLSDEQRQQLLSFYMDSSHRFGQNQGDSARRQLDSFAPGLFDVETAFWNESSSTLSNAFNMRSSDVNNDGSSGQAQPQESGSSNGQQHNGLAMLAALAPHAAPQQQGAGQQDEQGQPGDDRSGAGAAVASQNASHPQASPFAFNLDPAQPAWTDPLMGTLDLGPAYKQ
ncbi:unnamed protein product [Parajaminaea phylloscopi]